MKNEQIRRIAKAPNPQGTMTPQDYYRRYKGRVRKIRESQRLAASTAIQRPEREIPPYEALKTRFAELWKDLQVGRRLGAAGMYVETVRLEGDERALAVFLANPFFEARARRTVKNRDELALLMAQYVMRPKTKNAMKTASRYGRVIVALFNRGTPVDAAAETVMAVGIEKLAREAAKTRQVNSAHEEKPEKPRDPLEALRKAGAEARALWEPVSVPVEASPDLFRQLRDAPEGKKLFVTALACGSSEDRRIRLIEVQNVNSLMSKAGSGAGTPPHLQGSVDAADGGDVSSR